MLETSDTGGLTTEESVTMWRKGVGNGIVNAFLIFMTLWSLLMCYFTDPGYVNSFFKSSLVPQNRESENPTDQSTLFEPV